MALASAATLATTSNCRENVAARASVGQATASPAVLAQPAKPVQPALHGLDPVLERRARIDGETLIRSEPVGSLPPGREIVEQIGASVAHVPAAGFETRAAHLVRSTRLDEQERSSGLLSKPLEPVALLGRAK